MTVITEAMTERAWAEFTKFPSSSLHAMRAALDSSGLAAEVERLAHDIERHIAIAASEFERAEAAESRIAELERAASGLTEAGRVDERRDFFAALNEIFVAWSRPSFMRLHAGEMTAQEVRSVVAVLNCISREILALPQSSRIAGLADPSTGSTSAHHEGAREGRIAGLREALEMAEGYEEAGVVRADIRARIAELSGKGE